MVLPQFIRWRPRAIMSCLDAPGPAVSSLLCLRKSARKKARSAVSSLADQKHYILAAFERRGHLPEVRFAIDRLAVDLEDDHPRLNANVLSEGVWFDLGHQHTLGGGEAQLLHLLRRQCMNGDAKL